MGRFLNPDYSAFETALNSEIYIDKTGLLAYTNKVINTKQAFICNSRPRRFGKSVTADMLTAYYSKGCDSADIFADYEISHAGDFRQHLNKYDVIHLDIQWCLAPAKGAAGVVSYIEKSVIAELKEKYGKGFDFSSLYKYVKFHQEFPQILDSLRPKSGRPLSWTHYRILLQETSSEARAWYAKEAQEQAWSVRTLQRNISSQYYYRMLMSQNVESVEKEMKELTASYQADKLEFIKNPVIAEFLGLSSNTDFTESELEQRIITHIQKFLMELGKG